MVMGHTSADEDLRGAGIRMMHSRQFGHDGVYEYAWHWNVMNDGCLVRQCVSCLGYGQNARERSMTNGWHRDHQWQNAMCQYEGMMYCPHA